MTISFDTIQNRLPSDVTEEELTEIKQMLQQRLAELSSEERGELMALVADGARQKA